MKSENVPTGIGSVIVKRIDYVWSIKFDIIGTQVYVTGSKSQKLKLWPLSTIYIVTKIFEEWIISDYKKTWEKQEVNVNKSFRGWVVARSLRLEVYDNSLVDRHVISIKFVSGKDLNIEVRLVVGKLYESTKRESEQKSIRDSILEVINYYNYFI